MHSNMASRKRQRIEQLCSIDGISQVALEKVLASLRNEPIDGIVSRRDIGRAIAGPWNKVRLKLPFPMLDGSTFHWDLYNFQKEVSYVLSRCPGLEKIYAAAHARHPSSIERPWALLIGFDEYTLGDALGQTTNEKL